LFSTAVDDGRWSVEHWDDKTPERLLLSKEGLEQIEHAIQKLPNLQRQTIIFRDVEGLEAIEACSLLGVSMTNQRVLLHRARTKVRQVLAQYL
jgi:RNA polymerase sigma-70 factor (ECF subfamily)